MANATLGKVSELRTIEKLLRQQAALADFGSFAFREVDLKKILSEAARICAESLEVPYAKICRYRQEKDDLLVETGHGWPPGILGRVISPADETSTQGRAFRTGAPIILEDVATNNTYALPPFYAEHGIVSTADVLIKGKGQPYGVLEVDAATQRTFDQHDIDFLTGFANVVAEAVRSAERTSTLRTTVEMMESLIVDKDRLLADRQRLLGEKDVLAEELQHRVRNNLQLIYGMLTRQVELADEGSGERFRSIARRVMSLATIYDHLLGSGLSRTIEFSRFLRSLCDNLHDFQGPTEFDVRLLCEAEAMSVDLDVATALGLVVAEVVANAYLHAFKRSAGTVRVNLARNQSGAVLTIGDDGIGFVEPKESKRHGLGLIRRLMQQIEGSVSVNADRGTTWTLVFPLRAAMRQASAA